MGTLRAINRLARYSLSCLLPLRCALCGGPVAADSEWPLCKTCEDSVVSAINRDADSIRCPVCGKPTISESGLCMRCRATEYGFDSAYPLSRYADDARTLLLAYKSRGRRSLAGFYAKLLADAVRERYAGRVLVPVPPRPGKIRRKGWDQVERIAGILERRYGVQIARILYRTDGLQQKGLGRDDRAANMRGRIRLQGDRDIPREPVLLDDVLTTGATLSECAAALKAAGAQRVDALAIAAD